MAKDIKLGIELGVDDAKAKSKLSAFGKQTSTFGAKLGRFAKVGLAATAAGIAAVGTAAVTTAGKFEQWNVAFETMLGSGEAAQKLMDELSETARKTPFLLTDIVQNSKLLLGMGIEADKVVDTMRNLGDVAAGLGVPLERLALNFGQVQAQGKLTGRELRDFAIAGVPLLDQLAKQLGVSKAAVQDMVSAGKIGFKEVELAFANMTSEGGRFNNLMEKQSKTLFGIFSNIRDNLTQIFAVLGETRLLAPLKAIATSFKEITGEVLKWAKAQQEAKNESEAFTNILVKLGKSQEVLSKKEIKERKKTAKIVEQERERQRIALLNLGEIELEDIRKLSKKELEILKARLDEQKNLIEGNVKDRSALEQTNIQFVKENEGIITEIIKNQQTIRRELRKIENEERIQEEKEVQAAILEGQRQAGEARTAQLIEQEEIRQAIQRGSIEGQQALFEKTQERIEKEKALEKEKADNFAKWQDFMMEAAESSNKELSFIVKAAAQTNILIKSYEAAMGAYAALAGIPIVGPALGAAAAAAAISFGAEQVGKLAGLETGGIVTGNGIFELGEKNKKEAVIPLESPKTADILREAAGGVGLGDQNINIQFNLEGDALDTFTEVISNKQTGLREQGRL